MTRLTDLMDQYVQAKRTLAERALVESVTLHTDSDGRPGPLWAVLAESESCTRCLYEPLREEQLAVTYAEVVEGQFNVQLLLRRNLE